MHLRTRLQTHTNTRTYMQQCVDVDMSLNMSVCVHRSVLVRPYVSAVHTIVSNNYSPLWVANGGGRGEELAVTPMHKTSSGPMWQLKLDACVLSVSSKSYKGLQLSECY